MNASMAETPGNVFKAPQCGERAVQHGTAGHLHHQSIHDSSGSGNGTVRMTAPHSLHVMSA